MRKSEVSTIDEIADIHDLEEEKFVARRKRTFLPCMSDRSQTETFFEQISLASKKTSNGFLIYIKICHIYLRCHKCSFMQTRSDCKLSCISSYRQVKLHTLIHGTLDVSVVDYTCSKCHAKNYFDGADVALFAASSGAVFSRELLDL